MAGKIVKKLKLEIPGGQANPAPPVGPALGQAGVNIGEFVSKFNEASQSMVGDIVPVEIRVYDDRSFDFTLKTPPAASLLKKAAGVEKGSGKNLLKKAGTVTEDQVKQIADQKMADLNANDQEAAVKIIKGTARSMGMEVR